MKLLSDESSNAKLSKNDHADWRTWILYLAPADIIPGVNLCPAASAGCRAACLFTAGRGQMSSVQAARVRKTVYWRDDRAGFLRDLVEDLERVSRLAFKENGQNQAVRLNGTSDIAWEETPVTRNGTEHSSVMAAFPEIQFYDYTKRPERAAASLRAGWPSNYALTFSRAEHNGPLAERLAQRGANVAVVFAGKELPAVWHGRRVIDGTAHDMRFLDPKGVVVGLLAKGLARRDTSGFVVIIEEQLNQSVA